MADAERQPLVRKHSRRPGWSVLRRQERAYRPSTWDAIILAAVTSFGILAWQISASFIHHDPKNRTYDGEKIPWTVCGTLNDRKLECSNITVPMDHFNQSNNGPDRNLHFTIPLIRLRGKNVTNNINILVNPGGPGGSGVRFLFNEGKELNTVIGENYHLLTFDPRGVNGSTPLASCYPTEEARRELSTVRNKKTVEDSGELWAWTSNFVKGGADTMGPHGAYINTPQTAADMNSILDAIGQQDMYYWGMSYGTLLGQTYATLFPERSKRVIIDGVVNQFEWYNSIVHEENLLDADEVFFGFCDECLQAGRLNCALAEFADTPNVLADLLVNSVEKLRDDPVAVYVNSTLHGVLDYWAVWYGGVFPTLYKPSEWRTLASNLASLLQGNATDAYLAYGRGPPSGWETVGDGNTVIALNDGPSGPKKWPAGDRKELVKQIQEIYKFSPSILFHEGSYKRHFSKQGWTIPTTHCYVPKKEVHTAHPLLILSTTLDPVCPLRSARSANEAFVGSKIVEIKGYGHCSFALPSLCIAKHVRAFFDEGKLPETNVECKADGKPYFAKPDEESKGLIELQSLSEEDQRVHLAQVGLAKSLRLAPSSRF